MPDIVTPSDGYRFLLRFRMAKRIDSPLQELDLADTGLSRPIILASDNRDQQIGESNWLVARSRGYSSKQEAHDNGQRLKDALLLSGADCGIGVDVGMDRVTSGWGRMLKDAWQAESGIMVRDDVLGLDVFEDVEVLIPRLTGELTAIAGTDPFLKSIHELSPLAPFMDNRSRMSAQLINDALFPLTPETRLVILMTAIVSLWGRPKRNASIAALTEALLVQLKTMEGSNDDKEDVAKKVNDIRVQSSAGCATTR